MMKIGRNCNEHSVNVSHFFVIVLYEWARPGGWVAYGQTHPGYGDFCPAPLLPRRRAAFPALPGGIFAPRRYRTRVAAPRSIA